MKTTRQQLEQLNKFKDFFEALQGLIGDVSSIESLGKQAKEAEVLRDRYKAEYEDYAARTEALKQSISDSNKKILQAKQRIDEAAEQAKKESAEILALAQGDASEIITKANNTAATIIADAERVRASILAENALKAEELNAFTAALSKKQVELADIEIKIDAAREKIKKMLGD